MKTLKVDACKRIRLPDARPRQVFAYENRGDGTILLTEVKPKAQEPFPPGSLAKYMTKERDELETAIVRGCVQGPV
ncbi:MAG TPA: hypothetical protein PKX23_07730 [Verrucomicrobiota bacterium]|nr:hypothetical protein [Verrucomicrobiota bacterium]HRT10304.1 hypothetical protein [Candidatus Paceibacterota bacterium]HRT58060.1 hypothetical protein [Candidatus Paceibacterota bacterium]